MNRRLTAVEHEAVLHHLRGLGNKRRSQFDMGHVTVLITELLDALRKNRSKHREMFEKAREGYRKKAKETFEQQLKLAEEGFEFQSRIFFDPPHDHTKDYDQAIKMLEMELNGQVVSGRVDCDGAVSNISDEKRLEMAVIDISQQDFAQFVQDDWGWKESFTANTMSYGVS